MHKVTSRWPHQGSIKIEWNLGKRCNYDCSYCPKEIHDNTSEHTDLEILKKTLDKLASLNKPIRLSFTGGEPCVHPKFHELIKYARYCAIPWISVTTNGTRPYDYYSSLPVDQFVVSMHFEYEWTRTLENIKKIHKLATPRVFAQIMAHHDHMPKVREARAILNQEQIPNTVRRIRWTQGDHDLFDDMRYHPDDLTWIKSSNATVEANTVVDDKDMYHANDIIKLHMNKFNGWTCSAGIESLMINWDGEVHRATCRVGGSLGNIYEDTFVAPSDPVMCDRNFCTCAADIPLTKYEKYENKESISPKI